jgi:hypothetical protein
MAQSIAPASRPDMQAVIVVHGMGEQIPMETLKGFVDAVWVEADGLASHAEPNPTEIWSHPDARTGSLELRRITTRASIPSEPEFPGGVRTDFYELYWADLTGGLPWDALTGWVKGLLCRPLERVPNGMRLAWGALWLASFIIVLLAVLAILPSSVWTKVGLPGLADWHWLFAAMAALLTAKVHRLGTSTFGRVVRYTRADPDNIAARAAVRERGLKLLRAVHEGQRYKRIVIVAHSLGAILAHDLLSYFWAECAEARTFVVGSPEFEALCAVEHAAARLAGDTSEQARTDYRAAQRVLSRLLASRPKPASSSVPDPRWLISDFVTLGSPLTHAEFLLAADRDDLDKRKERRELPEAPPYPESLDTSVLARAEATYLMPIAPQPADTRLMSYPVVDQLGKWMLHHAAPFAAVRWTNVYDPAKLVFFGDVIGGPHAPVFGRAIVDINLKERRRRQSWTFTHTKYWARDEAERIDVCREAVNLLDA